MEITQEFDVEAASDEVWSCLLDVERVVPCMPGAELTEVVDDRTWKGTMKIKFGPVAMVFAGIVTMQERDDDAHRVVLSASGRESKGKGAANASVTTSLEPGEGTTAVRVQADVTLTGVVAQISRGLLPDVAAKLTQQFAECLRERMGVEGARVAGESAPAAGAAPTAPAIGGIRLIFSSIAAAIGRALRRVVGRGSAR